MEATPEIEATLESLTNLCCEALTGKETLDLERVESLTANLSTNGWERHSENSPPLSNILKDRIKDRCREPAMHRGAAIDGLVEKIQSAYSKASLMKASSPGTENDEQAMPPRSTG